MYSPFKTNKMQIDSKTLFIWSFPFLYCRKFLKDSSTWPSPSLCLTDTLPTSATQLCETTPVPSLLLSPVVPAPLASSSALDRTAHALLLRLSSASHSFSSTSATTSSGLPSRRALFWLPSRPILRAVLMQLHLLPRSEPPPRYFRFPSFCFSARLLSRGLFHLWIHLFNIPTLKSHRLFILCTPKNWLHFLPSANLFLLLPSSSYWRVSPVVQLLQQGTSESSLVPPYSSHLSYHHHDIKVTASC